LTNTRLKDKPIWGRARTGRGGGASRA